MLYAADTDATILVLCQLNFLFDVCAVDLVDVLLHSVNTQFERRDHILSTEITFRLRIIRNH